MDIENSTVLITDDDLKLRGILRDILEFKGFNVLCCKDGLETIRAVKENSIDAALLDLILPNRDGLSVLKELIELRPEMPVIMISGKATIQMAVKATKIGAYDFLEKPLDADRVMITLKNALEKSRLARQVAKLKQTSFNRYHMIGESESIKHVFELIESTAPTNGRVLIRGESGTGKELVAHSIHELSPRNTKPLIKINCAAVHEDLIESELFGHRKGAFTGALENKEGVFQRAHQSTLFLDEIADMSYRMQAKVLRALEEGEVQKVGSNEIEAVDIRLISATNKDLLKQIEKKKFREDLYYRLNVVEIYLPPLRERAEDIPLFIDHYVLQCCSENNIRKKEIAPPALAMLREYDWPGNVRELRNAIERLVIMSPSDTIEENQVKQVLYQDKKDREDIEKPKQLKEARDVFEKKFILRALDDNNWNIARTSKALNYGRVSLYKKMRKLGIIKEDEF